MRQYGNYLGRPPLARQPCDTLHRWNTPMVPTHGSQIERERERDRAHGTVRRVTGDSSVTRQLQIAPGSRPPDKNLEVDDANFERVGNDPGVKSTRRITVGIQWGCHQGLSNRRVPSSPSTIARCRGHLREFYVSFIGLDKMDLVNH